MPSSFGRNHGMSYSGLMALRFSPDDLIDDRYRVVRFLAAGGMGDVYEVFDTDIEMTLALKMLQPDLADEEDQRQRFLREIRLASQVTHPSVCRIYGSGIHLREDGVSQPFLTMELLDGETLAARLESRGRLDPDETMAIARQLADALEAAHAVGIVHRDFKTGNIMLVPTPGGQERVVVTDFGLARATETEERRQQFVTLADESAMVGTAAFMAPEQVVGDEQTAATDIYAFGIVLFFMLSGQMPFAADGLLPAAVARLQKRPRSLRSLRPDLPRRWSSVVDRCLERKPGDRFQDAGDVVSAIQGQLPIPVPNRVRRQRRRILFGALGSLLLVAIMIAAWRRGEEATMPIPQVSDPVQLTIDEGLEIDPVFSPDGSTLYYSADRAGRFELWMRSQRGRIGTSDTGTEARLPTQGLHAVQPAVAPDGRRLAYVTREPRGIWVLDIPGDLDSPEEVRSVQLTQFGSRPAWTPDGVRIIFQADSRTDVAERSLPALPPSNLWQIPSDGGEPTPVTDAGSPPGGHGEPAVSPRGRFVAFSSGDRRRTSIWRLDLEEFDLEGRVVPEVLADRSRVNLHPQWSADGRFLYWLGIAEGLDRQAAAYAIWRQPLDAEARPAGVPQQVTRLGVATIRQFTLYGAEANTTSLIYGALNTYSHLWALPLEEGLPIAEPVQWTRGKLRHSRPAFTPDGRELAYDRWQVGTNLDIWVKDVQRGHLVSESEPRQVTFAGEWDSQATWLPGGDRFAFFSEREGKRGIWIADAATGRTELLADIGADPDWARLSPDGTRIAYHSRKSGSTLDVWVYDVVLNEHLRLTHDPEMAAFPIWSPDGQRLGIEVRRDGSTQVAIMPAAGGEVQVLTHEEGESWPYSWSPDGSRIAFAALRDGFWHLRWVDTRDGQQQQLTDHRRLNAYVRYPTWSPEGSPIVYELSETVGDLWRIEVREQAR
ncbi:MAG: serine/threonine-protein kinase [Thermoanaerobaculia bacterium]|nr:serine/threonine-protein kinase [Thermoanaerobaculia bacterium]